MAKQLPVSRLVRVDVSMSPVAAQRRGFGTLLVVTDDAAISAAERIRTYSGAEDVIVDFGANSETASAALAYFGQSPKPKQMMVGRFVKTASAASLLGGILSSAQQAMSNFTSITAGALTLNVDGASVALTAIDLSAATNLAGVASALTTKAAGKFTARWTGERFEITSPTTGASSAVDFATDSPLAQALRVTASLGAAKYAAAAAETPVQAVTTLMETSGAWYGLHFATQTALTAQEQQSIAALVEAASMPRVFGITSQDTKCLDATATDDIASVMKAAKYRRTFVQYSGSSKYAACSFMGRAFSVNFSGNKTTITLMYKQEPGVTAENLTTNQANALQAKNCNVFVAYQNDTAIIQYGKMADGGYFDEVHGTDWFADAVQNAQWNALYGSTTKIPQTDAGQAVLITAVAGVCDEAINNGLIAPGTWNANGFGQLKQGDFLKDGFYIYAEPIYAQAQSIREQRIAPPITVGIKLAGAFHEVDVLVNVNR